jgi:hypothetical protein
LARLGVLLVKALRGASSWGASGSRHFISASCQQKQPESTMRTLKNAVVVAAFTVSVIAAHAQSWLTNGLVAYYPFNGNANDASGNGNNGSIYGGVVLAPDRFGIPNSAHSFNGVDGYIDIGNPVGNSPAYLTETAWVKIISREVVSGLPSLDAIITKRQSDESGWATLGVVSSGQTNGAGVIAIDDYYYYVGCTGTILTQTNVWFFICGVVSNGIYQIYINGSLENTITDAHTLSSVKDMFLMHQGSWGTYCNGVLDDVRIYNRALSSNEVAQLYAIESTPSPHAATGVATLDNAFVVGVRITNGGYGYTNTPLVRFIGGGGSGAQAVAVVSNGMVTAINVLNAGYGYTNAPLVVIDPPFVPNPVLGIAPMSFLSFSNLAVGGSYQLQQFVGWYWANQPVSFTATNALYTQMVAGVWDSGDFRLALNPVPAQAFATAQMGNGFVIGATVTSGGSGYVTSPAVNIVGGHGTNATAVSQISGGVVTNISITSAGIGYTSTPTIQIAPPPAAAVFPTVQPVMRVDSASLAPYDNYQIQFKPDIMAPWLNWDGGLFTSTDVTNSQFLFITNGTGFFQLLYEP